MSKSYIGIVFILLHSLFDISFYIICKLLQTNNVHNFSEEVIFVLFYNFKALILLLLIFILQNFNYLNLTHPFHILTTNLNKHTSILYLTMSIFSAAGFIIFLYGLNNMIIANAISLKYIEQMVWVLIGAFILKEKITLTQLQGILISLCGIILVIVDNIHTDKNFLAYYFPIIAASCWAISSSVGKHIVSNNLNLMNHMIYYYGFHLIALVILAILISFLENIEFSELNINMGSYEFIIHILSMSCFYMAMQKSPMSLLAPFVYIKLIFSFILGYFIFSETYNILNLFGYILIISGGLRILVSIQNEKG